MNVVYRKCNHDHPFSILLNNGKYLVVNDGSTVLETDSLPEAEEKYLGLCDAAHSGSVGKYIIGKHKLVNGQVKML